MEAHAARLRERRLSVGSRAWKWVREHAIVIYGVVAIAYMLIPIGLIIVFSFNDPAGKFNFTWQGFTLSNWAHPFEISELTDALLVSLRLAALATLISTVIAIPLGTLAAVRQNTWVDYGVRVVSIGGLAIPAFWTGILIILFLVL